MQKELLYGAIDVSKERLDVEGAALALPEQLGNDQAGYGQLIQAAKKYPGVVQFVFEASGPYHLGLALALWEASIALSVLNPARVRYFAKAQGKAKTDPLDKQVIGAFAQAFRPQPTPAPDRVQRELILPPTNRISSHIETQAAISLIELSTKEMRQNALELNETVPLRHSMQARQC
jgi:transposase